MYKKTGFAHFKAAFTYSMAGLKAALRYESAFRQEAAIFLLALPAIWWLATSLLDAVALLGVLLLVLIVELLNSAIEAVVDRVGYDPHELSGRAKDLGSAAVMLSLVLAGLVWSAYLWQKLSSGF